MDRAAAVAADAKARLLIICAYRPDDRADTTSDASRLGPVRNPGTEQAEHALHADAVFHVIGSTPAHEILDRAQERAATFVAVEVQTLAVQGQPAERIVDTAGSQQADLVVVGNQGLNSLRGRLLGSVPQTISHTYTSDVLIAHTVE